MLIKNGNIVLESGIFQGDILIENEKIKEIGTNIESEGKVLDASDKYIMPGLIDVHTHFNIDVGIAKSVDDFYTGTVAAACGGTTTIVDHMGFGPKGCKLGHQLDVYQGYAKDMAVIDYGFHGVIQHVDDEVIASMETLIEKGLTSYKVYMTYDYKLNDQDILKVMEKAKKLGIMITVHPEIDGVIKYFKNKFHEENKLEPMYHEKSRPEDCEGEAIDIMNSFSHMLGDVPLYIVHLSNKEGLNSVKKWREKGLKNLYLETCPQYLLLSDECYKRDDALKFILSPPLRGADNNKILWNALVDDTIDTVATDHCSFNYNGDKQKGKDDFTKCPNGMPGVETRGYILIGQGVDKGMEIGQIVKKCSENPAKLFGMYPKKGTLKVGSDADILVVDMNGENIIKHKNLHENVDYTPFESEKVKCKFDYVISRGEIIVENNVFIGEKGRGQFLNRDRPILYKNS
ncbi:MAG: dihydropyrimidinase [Lachnospirales bacterium]